MQWGARMASSLSLTFASVGSLLVDIYRCSRPASEGKAMV
jgi:hypothetical protein